LDVRRQQRSKPVKRASIIHPSVNGEDRQTTISTPNLGCEIYKNKIIKLFLLLKILRNEKVQPAMWPHGTGILISLLNSSCPDDEFEEAMDNEDIFLAFKMTLQFRNLL